MMLKREFHRNSEFNITVKYYKRNQSYKVKHQLLNEKEEVFYIIKHNRVVELKSTKAQPGNKVAVGNGQQVYTYDEHVITNKCLMNRIIEAIDNYTRVRA